MRRAAILLVLLGVLAGAAGAVPQQQTVARVTDGDTIALASGARVRLVQIDAPEVGSGECYSRASARELRRLLPVGTPVVLEADSGLDRVDRYGRLLRYVRRGALNVNLELVRRGAATVWLYDGDHGRYAARLLAAAREARLARRGLWGACRTTWDPYGPATTSPRTRSRPARAGSCDPSYRGVCIPPAPPDLDCADVAHSGFRVVGADPHRFDGDGDGLGCE